MKNPLERDTLPLEGVIPLQGARDPDAALIETTGWWIIDQINYVWYWTLSLDANDAATLLVFATAIFAAMVFSGMKGPHR